MTNKKRPTPITIIAWYLIIVYALALVSIPLVLFIPTVLDTFEAMEIPVGLSLGFTVLSSAIMIFSGISILKEKKLGKLLALGYMPVAMIVGSLLNGFQSSMIFGIIIYIAIFYFLSRENAVLYFNHEWIAPVNETFETKELSSSAVGSNLLVYERVVNGSVEATRLTVDLQDTSTKQPGMAKMIIGTAFFFFGDNTLITYFAFILPVTMALPQGQGILIGAIIFSVILFFAAILILIGFLVWGFKHGRRLIMLGTFVTGAWTVLGALGLISLPFMPQYRELQELQQSQAIDLTSMGLYLLVAGILNLIIAACLSPEFKKFVSTRMLNRQGS
ncbi:MAG: hypothetical protein KA282_00345 [Clostridia bacterium]|nr:hypothetical protein [Clostridia bacterium]